VVIEVGTNAYIRIKLYLSILKTMNRQTVSARNKDKQGGSCIFVSIVIKGGDVFKEFTNG
jgi:hypothetical protein